MRPFLKRLRENNDVVLWSRLRLLTALPLFLFILTGMQSRLLGWIAIALVGIGLLGRAMLKVLWAWDYDEDQRRAKAADRSDLAGNKAASTENAALENREELQRLGRK